MAAGDPGTRKRNYSATAIQTTLVNSITAAATGDTTTSVAVVSVSGFPSTVPYTLILDPDGSKEEVVTVTAATSTTLTITRGQDNTAALSHAAGTAVRHGVSAREFKELQTHIAARGYDADSAILSGVDTHVHGLATGDGSVVGSDQLVTLTRKTLTTPTINGATLTGTVTSTASIVVSGAGTITGLSSAGMSTSSATPKSYVDAILGSATAASTSATSAATSATSAATSATSAAASATASASSASAAATSASSALTSQTAAATSATSAAASATAAATSATSAAASATSSASSASASATSASAAATSASSAATSVTTAQAWATQLVTAVSGTDFSAKYNANLAATSAASAATSAASSAASTSAAAASATAAATSATSAAASATAAATSATSAAASATAAATSATSAAASATASATSAGQAATSASSAATSATSAAASATSAATTYTAYDARYLGSKASAPTVDNLGGALITGATYWNTSTNTMYVWSGSAWTAISTTGYSAPTLGSTTIASGTTYANITGLTINSTTIPTSKTLVATDSTAYVVPAVSVATTLNSYTSFSQVPYGGQQLNVFSNQFYLAPYGSFTSGDAAIFNAAFPVGSVVTASDSTQSGTFTVASAASINGGGYLVVPITTSEPSTIFFSGATTLTAGVSTAGKYLTNNGSTSSWGTVAGYSAPTLGSTSIASGSTNTTLIGFTKLRSNAFTSLDANSREQDIALMNIMGAW